MEPAAWVELATWLAEFVFIWLRFSDKIRGIAMTISGTLISSWELTFWLAKKAPREPADWADSSCLFAETSWPEKSEEEEEKGSARGAGCGSPWFELGLDLVQPLVWFQFAPEPPEESAEFVAALLSKARSLTRNSGELVANLASKAPNSAPPFELRSDGNCGELGVWLKSAIWPLVTFEACKSADSVGANVSVGCSSPLICEG